RAVAPSGTVFAQSLHRAFMLRPAGGSSFGPRLRMSMFRAESGWAAAHATPRRWRESMKPWLRGRRGAALMICLPALALFPACCGDSTTGPEADALNEAENGSSAGVSQMAIGLDETTMQSVPTWMTQGAGAGLRSATSTWDADAQQWVITASENYSGTEADG